MTRYSLLFALAVLPAIGCVPVTEPLGNVNKAAPDKGLVGKWKVTKNTGQFESSSFTSLVVDAPVVKGNPKGLMRADVGAGVGAPVWWFYTHALGKRTYAVVLTERTLPLPGFEKEGAFAKWAKGKEKGYFVFRYALDGDKLTLDVGDYDAFSKHAGAADIKGDGGKYFQYFFPPAGWLAKHYEKNADAIYDGAHTITMAREKK